MLSNELALLSNFGHEVHPLYYDNTKIFSNPYRLINPVQGLKPIWNPQSYQRVVSFLAGRKVDLAHIHNFFFQASPSVYYALKRKNIPVVQTLHNYRLLCLNALFLREYHVCEDCLGRFPLRGIIHACYRGSRAASAVVASMLSAHRLLGTWTQKVDMYIALTEFARQKFIKGGLPAEKIMVKPNFVFPDPGLGDGEGNFALFAGRLSPEKGLETLLAAWELLKGRAPLKIVGDGPLASNVAEASRRLRGVEWLGRKPRAEVLSLMQQAAFLVLPSMVYENFPMTIAEAYASGLPVIASNLGASASLIEHGRTGLHFRPGDPDDLAAKVEWLLAHPAELVRMRKEARAEYEAKYTAERNYNLLMQIYERAIENAKKA